MPQGRRKVPFSGKAKKQQLQSKKHFGKAQDAPSKHVGGGSRRNHVLMSDCEGTSSDGSVRKLNFQPGRNASNRYVLQFHVETQEEIKRNKDAARQSLVKVSEEALEINIDDYFPPKLTFPTRPPWDLNMSKDQLEAKENKYFTEYIKTLEETYSWSEISYFELNLETWRQLWRVLEMADIVLVIVDIRFPALMFPPFLYEYITKKLKKEVILVLNKIDLAPPHLVVAWKHYLVDKFPGIHIVTFTSFPSYNVRGNMSNKSGLKIRRRKGKLRMSAEGAQKLLDVCKEIVKDSVDLTSWQEKIKEEMTMEYDDEEIDVQHTVELKQQDTSYEEHERYKNGVLTIGCVGQPNVGKSSLMNAIMGKKVVSVSRTPGHTKHFQTIFLTKNVRLCDCPGLVFPSKVPKPLQILMGSFPIAQVREPFSTVKYLAERIDLISLLKIKHPENCTEWSAMDVCEGWAKQKGFYTARAARLDAYRGANHLLRMALDGKISMCLTPPNYAKTKSVWKNNPEVDAIKWIQAVRGSNETLNEEDESDLEGSSDEEVPAKKGATVEEVSTSEKEDDGDDDDDDDDDDEDVPTKVNRFHLLS